MKYLQFRNKIALLLSCICVGLSGIAYADNKKILTDEMEAYLEFVEYGGGVIFAEQIPKEDWKNMVLIDARDAKQFAAYHIPGAINIEWRQVLTKRNSIPKDKPVLIYCNSGSLSAQAGFALRLVNWENVLILQGGMDEWRTKGGFDAASKAAKLPSH
ncbi:rhodanese-like domain-containing protein [Undibacterium sp.]|uniref:rhodanese-like domain-containing protein n=1 Tax=Undibacterium sp. TaxID=1914977 RepID=UPI003752DEA3